MNIFPGCSNDLKSIFTLVLLLCGFNSANANALSDITDIAVGTRHLCLLDTNGNIECRLRNSSETHLLPPDDIPLLSEIGAGDVHTCGITRAEGKIVCFGLNSFGQLDAPIDTGRIIGLSVGDNHSCALSEDNQIYCWGLNSNGQLNVESSVDEPTQKVLAADNFSCILKYRTNFEPDIQDRTTCWSTAAIPSELFTAGATLELAGGERQVCYLLTYRVVCIDRISDLEAVQLVGNYHSIATSGSLVCAINTSNELNCKGPNDQPSEELDNITAPFGSAGDRQFKLIDAVSRGVGFCAVTLSNEVICSNTGITTLSDSSFVDRDLVETTPPVQDSATIVQLNLEVYGTNLLELFWVVASSPEGQLPVSYEIYRNNELLQNTQNGSSFLDSSHDTTSAANYRIRGVMGNGTFTEFSQTVYLEDNHDSGNLNTPNPTPTDCGNHTLASPGQLSVQRYAPNYAELFWQPDQYAGSLLPTYEIYVNDELATDRPVANNGSFILSGNTQVGDGYRYKIRMIDRCNRASEFSSTAVIPRTDITTPTENNTGSLDNFCQATTLNAPDLIDIIKYADNYAELFWKRDLNDPVIEPEVELEVDGEIRSICEYCGKSGNGSLRLWRDNVSSGSRYRIRFRDSCNRVSAWSDSTVMPYYNSALNIIDGTQRPMEECPTPLPEPALDSLVKTGEEEFLLTYHYYQINWNQQDYPDELLSHIRLYIDGNDLETQSALYLSGFPELDGKIQYISLVELTADNNVQIDVTDKCGRVSVLSQEVRLD